MYYKTLLLIVCFLIFSSSSLAQTNKSSTPEENLDGESIKIDAELVTVPVIVSDKVGRYITDLSSEDFLVYENGVKQDIEFFSVEAAPFHVMLVIDTSSSVSTSISSIKSATLEFVNNLRDDDQVAAVGFSSRVYALTDRFTLNKNDLAIKLNFLQAMTSTSLYDAVYVAAHDVLKKITGRKAVILLTDGFDNSSRFSAEKAINEMVESGALVYVIRYPSGNPESQKLDFINELVDATAGVRYEAVKMNLSEPLQKIAEELRHIYTVGYYPSNPPENGSYRNIQVKVRERTDIAVRYKKGYDASTFASLKNERIYISDYDSKTLYKTSPSFYLESKRDVSIGLGLLSNTIDAKPYIGKRIRLTGYLKTKNVQSWAGMWMRIDDQHGKPINSDTMDDKLLDGTRDWMKYEIVLDVDEKSQAISYGVLLAGVGKVWISSPKIEVVDKTVPTTGTNNWQKYKIGETLTNAKFMAEK